MVDPGIATQTAMQIGDLARYGLETSLPTRTMEYFLEYAHVMSGLPWWGTIGVVVVGLRLAMMPLAAWSYKHQMRAAQFQPELTLLTTKLNTAKMQNDVMSTQLYTHELTKLRKKHDLSIFKPMLGNVVQIPFAIIMFLAIGDLVKVPITHMSSSGFFWITDLTQHDPNFILPGVSALSAMGVMELQSRLTSANVMSPTMKLAIRGLTVVGALATAKFSAAMLLFWIFNAATSIFQALLFNTATFRRFLGVQAIRKIKQARPQKTLFDNLDPSKLFGKKKAEGYVVPRKTITGKN